MIEVAHIVARVTTDLTRFNLGMSAAEARAKTASQKMSLTGQRMTKYLSLPIAAVGYAAVKSSLNFEQSMTQVSTQAGLPIKNVKALSETILNMAKKTTQGPNELAKAMYHVQSVMGNTPSMAKKLDILSQATKLSQIGSSDMEETTTALAAAIRTGIPGVNGYGEAWKNINGIVGAGNMRMQDFVNAVGTGVLPVAKLAGLTLKDVGAAMAVFTDEGMNASEGMTRFRTSLMMMQAPSDKAQKNMKKMGLSGEAIGKQIRTNGFVPTIKLLHDKMEAFAKGVGEKGTKMWRKPNEAINDYLNRVGKTKAFATFAKAFGGSRTAGTLMLLVNQAGLLDQKMKQITKTASNSDKALAASSKTSMNQLKKAWSSVQVALIKFGAALTPVVLGAAKALARIADAFSKLPKPVQHTIAMFALGLAVMGPLMIVGVGMVTMFKQLAGAVKLLGFAFQFTEGAIAVTPAGWILLAAVILIMILRTKTAQRVIKTAFNFIRNHIVGTVGAIAQFVKTKWPYIIGAMAGPIGLLVVYVIRHFRQILGFFKRAAKWFYNAAKHIGHMIAKGIKDGMGSIGHFVKNAITAPGRSLGGKIEGLFHPGKAAGGPVNRYRPYVVGEHGPELFIPGHNGRIVSNEKLGGPVGESQRMEPARDGGPLFTVGEMHVRSQEDAEVLSAKLARRVFTR